MKYVWLNYFQGLKRQTPCLQIHNCQYWIQAKLNVLDNVYLNSAITYSTGRSFWVIDLILLSTQFIFRIFLFYKRKSSGWKNTLMQHWNCSCWEISNAAYVNCKISAHTPGNSISMENVKKTVLSVKSTHSYYCVVSEKWTNNYKPIHKPKETEL